MRVVSAITTSDFLLLRILKVGIYDWSDSRRQRKSSTRYLFDYEEAFRVNEKEG